MVLMKIVGLFCRNLGNLHMRAAISLSNAQAFKIEKHRCGLAGRLNKLRISIKFIFNMFVVKQVNPTCNQSLRAKTSEANFKFIV